MRKAIKLLDAYALEQHPHTHAELFRIDRLRLGWLAVFGCQPGGKDQIWVPG